MAEWKDIAGTVAKAAPMLGTLLGGPVGGVIGGVVSLIASAFGLTPEQATPDKIQTMLQTDPAAAIKLAEIEANHKLELQKLILEQNRIELSDTADARAREKAIVQATGRVDKNLYALAWLIVIGFFFLTAVLMYHELPKGSNEVVFMLFGALSSGFGTVLGYFFGSSRGSFAKSQLIANK